MDGFGIIMNRDGKYNYIDENGKILSETWFADAWSFDAGLAEVQNDDCERNIIKKNGKLLLIVSNLARQNRTIEIKLNDIKLANVRNAENGQVLKVSDGVVKCDIPRNDYMAIFADIVK